jgi:ABC-type multidrug transport system fused ATPase/permease subunit
MKKIFSSINYILNSNHRKDLLILIFFWLILHLLEAIGISSVPIIVSSFLDNNQLINFEIFKKFEGYLLNFLNTDNKILFISFLVILFFGIKSIFFIFLTIYEAKIFRKLNVSIRDLAFKSQANQEYSKYLNNSSSKITKIVITDSALAASYIISVVTILSQFFLFFFIVGLLAYVDFKITFYVIPTFGIIFLVFYLFTNKKLFRLGKEKQILNGKLLMQINNTFDNLKEVIIYNKIEYLISSFNKTLNESQKKTELISILKKLPRAIYEFLGVLFIFSIIFLSYSLNYSQESTLILISLIAVAIIRILPSINLITQNISNIKSSEYSLKLISELAKEYQYKNMNKSHKEVVNTIDFNQEIVIKNVSFEYPGSKNKIKNLNFSIKKNSIVGIYGPSGSGKSTIINLLCGLLKPSSGEIIVDGKSINTNVNIWQKKISYVTQDNFLLDDDIRNNIIFSDKDNNFYDEKFQNVVKKTSIDGFINNFENKYQTQVGDKGIKLSGGQKQRISIARALYKSPELLIFDESTNALDSITEKEIIDEIYKIKGITIILISHKRDLLAKCDKILNIVDGKIFNN